MQATAIDLDNLSPHGNADLSGMSQHIAAFPMRIIQGWGDAGTLSFPAAFRDVRHVVVQGMGGSSIAGDIAAEALDGLRPADGHASRIDVFRDYGSPSTVEPDSLVIILSHSGYTEEALSGLDASLRRGTRLIVMTGGGPLAQIAQSRGLPMVTMPGDSGPPRTYLPYALGAMLRILCELGIAPPEIQKALEDAVAKLELRQAAFAPATSQTDLGHDNPAKDLARDLAGRVPVIVSARGLASAARRWKTQFNENAKIPAWTEELPEMHHNAVVGFEQPGFRDNLAVILLGPPTADESSLHDRYAISRDFLSPLGVPVYWPVLITDTALARLLEAVLLGDYVSYYLALVNGIDPTPTETLDRVKARIRGSGMAGDRAE